MHKLYNSEVFNRKPVSGDKHKSCHDIKKLKAFCLFLTTFSFVLHPLDEANVCAAHTMANVCDVILANVHDLYVKLIIFYLKLRHTQVYISLCLTVV
jgi:hypothetical protein